VHVQVDGVLASLDLNLTEVETKMVLGDLEADEAGMVNYQSFIPHATKLLLTLKAARLALSTEHRRETLAEEKARRMAAATGREVQAAIDHIVAYAATLDRLRPARYAAYVIPI